MKISVSDAKFESESNMHQFLCFLLYKTALYKGKPRSSKLYASLKFFVKHRQQIVLTLTIKAVKTFSIGFWATDGNRRRLIHYFWHAFTFSNELKSPPFWRLQRKVKSFIENMIIIKVLHACGVVCI